MDVFAVGEPQLMDAARIQPRAVEKCDRARVLGHRNVEQFEPCGLQALVRGLVGDGHDVADRLQRVRAHMRLRQVAAGDDLGRARVADVDGGEVLRRALMGEPEDAAAVLGDLDRHAFADAAEAVELVVRQLAKFQIAVSAMCPSLRDWSILWSPGWRGTGRG